LPDYDIAGGLVVWRLAASPAAAPSRQFANDGLAPGVHFHHAGPNRRLVGPTVRVKTLGRFAQTVSFLGGAGPSRNAMVEFSKPRAQPGGVSATHGAA